MILCTFRNKWFLCTGINYEKGTCGLRTGKRMSHPRDFRPLPPMGDQMLGSVPMGPDITFFPNIAFHGMQVVPQYWEFESEEPILVLMATPCTMEDVNTPYYDAIRERIGARYPAEILMADGWEQPGQGEFVKRVHVDDLEKIEGPPPEGPF
jgi:hypothetical protein